MVDTLYPLQGGMEQNQEPSIDSNGNIHRQLLDYQFIILYVKNGSLNTTFQVESTNLSMVDIRIHHIFYQRILVMVTEGLY